MPSDTPISNTPLVKLTRRQMLQAAGGVTFLALTPTHGGLYAATFAPPKAAPGKSTEGQSSASERTALPLFTALPYLQPGSGSSALSDGHESIVIAWQTNSVPAKFTLDYGAGSLTQSAEIAKSERMSGDHEDNSNHRNYAATLANLRLNKRYQYRVRMNDEVLMEGYFTTRKPRGVRSRFVAFGDNSYGDISDRAIAYQTYRARPDFVMNTGDNVYEDGLDNEYARYFFPVYNAEQAGQRTGAPILRSVPFYSVLANHDCHGTDSQKHPVANFTLHNDALAYYTTFHFPLNGPKPPQATPTYGDQDAIAHFEQSAGARFPNMANYSFDYADAHFLCLDSNIYTDPTSEALQAWIVSDLKGTDAAWKFVVYHHPAFNAGDDHYAEQHMRVLSPIFEKYGVDVTLHGHEHTYQRTRPFKFAPDGLGAAKTVNSKKRLVPGTFTVDRKFDGQTVTKPNGVIYITTGAGGKHLYDPDSNNNPAKWRHPEDNNADYVARFVSDRHSLTVFDMDAQSLTLTQIDEWGSTIDRIRITKA